MSQHPDPIIRQFLAFYDHQQAGGDPDVRAWTRLAEEAAAHSFGQEGQTLGQTWAGEVALSKDLTDLALPITAYEFVRYLSKGRIPAKWDGPTPWRELSEKAKTEEWSRLRALRVEVAVLAATNSSKKDDHYLVQINGTGEHKIASEYGYDNLVSKLRELAAKYRVASKMLRVAGKPLSE